MKAVIDFYYYSQKSGVNKGGNIILISFCLFYYAPLIRYLKTVPAQASIAAGASCFTHFYASLRSFKNGSLAFL